jgi:hypothetical protein
MSGKIRKSAKGISRSAETDDDGAPLLATSAAFDMPTRPVRLSKKRGVVEGRGTAGQVSSRSGTINLKSVAQACIDEGLDPAAEIAKALKAQRPATDRSGNVVVGDDGKPVMVPLVDADTKIRVLTELLQYNQPKLKAVEMKVSGTLEMTADEIDNRISELLVKALK